MTSGGLGTMGYGLPAAVGVQIAHPEALVIDVAGEASILMNIQEMSTVAQYRLPVKVFIFNNQYMGMVRQWQELLHGGRYSESYTAALPDFVKLADAFGASGRRVENPAELDDAIAWMLETPGAVILDVAVDRGRELLSDDPVGRRAQRDAARPRGRGPKAGLRRRHGAGVSAFSAHPAAPSPASLRSAPSPAMRERVDLARDAPGAVRVAPNSFRHSWPTSHGRHRTPYGRRAGRQRAGHPRARRRSVFRARLQHREPDRRRGRPAQPPVADHRS